MNIKTYSSKRNRPRHEQLTVGSKTTPMLPTHNGSLSSSGFGQTVANSECLFAEDHDILTVATAHKKSAYEERKDTEFMEWTTVQEQLCDVYRNIQLPVGYTCSVCTKELTNPLRCLDCHPLFVCCAECEACQHRYVLHKPELWNVRIVAFICILFCHVKFFL